MSEAAHYSIESQASYTPEELTNLVFWTFYASQGFAGAQKQILNALASENPPMREAIMRIRSDMPAGSAGRDQLIGDLTQRLRQYSNSARHVNRGQIAEEDARGHAQKHFTNLLAASEQKGTPENQDRQLESFILQILKHECEYANKLERKSQKNAAAANELVNRKRIGFSMLCWYGLSPKREEHLAAPPPQPEEIKRLWRRAGDYLRANVGTLVEWPVLTGMSERRDRATRADLNEIIKRYQEATGENLGLSA